MSGRRALWFAIALVVLASCSSRSTPARDAGHCVEVAISPDAGSSVVISNPGF